MISKRQSNSGVSELERERERERETERERQRDRERQRQRPGNCVTLLPFKSGAPKSESN